MVSSRLNDPESDARTGSDLRRITRTQSVVPTRRERRDLQERQRAAKLEKGLSSSATRFVLVRHGETDWNAEHRLQGQKDPPLNALGVEQAEALGSRLKQEGFGGALYCSDLVRATQTAEIVHNSLAGDRAHKVTRTMALRERSLGVLEGLTAAEAACEDPEAWSVLCSPDRSVRVPGGESQADVEGRAVAGLKRIAERHPGECVAVVTHGGVLQALYRHAKGSEATGRFKNCAVNTLWIDRGAWKLGTWGDTCHLEGVDLQEEAFGGGCGG